MTVRICNIKQISDFSGIKLLSKERQEKLFRYVQRDDKLRCLGAGLLLYEVFGSKVNNIKLNPYGKPYIPTKNVFFNLSHSCDYVVLATDKSKVGIDIEKVLAVPSGIAEQCFTDDELQWLKSRSTAKESGRLVATKDFFKLWTAKESVMKAIGTGFSTAPKSFSIVPDDKENATCYVNEQTWFLHWYDLGEYIFCTASSNSNKAQIIDWTSDNL